MTPASERARPRVIALTDIPFWESAFGSHARLAVLFEALAQATDFSVLSFAGASAPGTRTPARIAFHDQVLTETPAPARPRPPSPMSRWRLMRNRARDDWLEAAWRHLCAEQPDAVIIEYLDRAWLLDAVPPETVAVLDAHDVMSQRTENFARFGMTPSIAATAREEARAMRMFDAVIAISAADATEMRRRLDIAQIVVASHAPAICAPRSQRPAGGPTRLVFVGSFAQANISGLKWFLDQVWPIVGARFELRVAGAVCDAITAPPPGVTLLGRVDDLGALLAETDIVINPVFAGGGLKIKTLEAMAAGLPSVNSAEAVRGLERAEGRCLLAADGRGAFVAHLLRLAREPALRAEMGAAAQAFVAEELCADKVYADLIALLRCARRKPVDPAGAPT